MQANSIILMTACVLLVLSLVVASVQVVVGFLLHRETSKIQVRANVNESLANLATAVGAVRKDHAKLEEQFVSYMMREAGRVTRAGGRKKAVSVSDEEQPAGDDSFPIDIDFPSRTQ